MIQSLIRKAVALFSSVSLVILFLLYRVGGFDQAFSNASTHLQTSHNGGAINGMARDTIRRPKDSIDHLLLSSSKVLILTDQKLTFPDSLKNLHDNPSISKKEIDMMSSSKSSIIFNPHSRLKISLGNKPLYFDSTRSVKKRPQ